MSASPIFQSQEAHQVITHHWDIGPKKKKIKVKAKGPTINMNYFTPIVELHEVPRINDEAEVTRLNGEDVQKGTKEKGKTSLLGINQKKEMTRIKVSLFTPQSEIVHTNAVATSDANGGTMSEAPIRAPFISHEQYNHLLTLLQNVPSHTAAGGSNDIVAGQATILHVDFDHTHAM
ncbi:hypothetical protein M9H77_12845 [Catharanthus roseus]|uniref:Uncharacterized protein n=1 Tax=Catharanthus roseus TaxID=4058 RepID=A0ACC0BII4_CATRO|nr:hypothetical protein M9H77_12845 [Catharanthus roseus]